MPTFDLRGIKIGKYTNTDGTITYDTPVSMGDAIAMEELNLTRCRGQDCTPRAALPSTRNS